MGFPAFSVDFDKDGWFDSNYSAATSGDYVAALSGWETLAKKGDSRAQYNIGVLFHNGFGIPQDYKKAEKWYRLSAQKRYANAQYNLGILYHDGHGQKRNAALLNYGVGDDYVSGRSEFQLFESIRRDDEKRARNKISHNYILAHMWFNLATSSGHEKGVKGREFVAKKLNPTQIMQAQDLARACATKNYKDC